MTDRSSEGSSRDGPLGDETLAKPAVSQAAPARRPTKRSFSIAGHRTSISLEEPFWRALVEAAQGRRQSVASLVAEIDRTRGETNLSSAIRVWLFERVRTAGRPETASRGSQGG